MCVASAQVRNGRVTVESATGNGERNSVVCFGTLGYLSGLVLVVALTSCSTAQENHTNDCAVGPGALCNTAGSGGSAGASGAAGSSGAAGKGGTGAGIGGGAGAGGAPIDKLVGNGERDCGEECDDGNTASGDGCSSTGKWEPIIGIAKPSWGLSTQQCALTLGSQESCASHPKKCFDFGTGLEPYPDAGNGPYTHYVDNTHPDCSDAQTFGTPTQPRCDIFAGSKQHEFAAGSVIELHGGPYKYGHTFKHFVAKGTAERPVYFRGISKTTKVKFSNLGDPAARFALRVSGSYLIIENIRWHAGAFVDNHGTDYLAYRHNEMTQPNGQFFDHGTGISAHGLHTVVYDNYIFDNHRPGGKDFHAVHADAGAEQVWVLDNELGGGSGDAFQACHAKACQDDAPRYIFIGRNKLHHDRENGLDFKTIRSVVASQNAIYGYTASSTSSGDAVVIGSTDGYNPNVGLEGHGPADIWLIYNDIHDSDTGIRNEGCKDAYLVGNFIHDNKNHGVTPDIKKNSEDFFIVNNTFLRNGTHIHHHWQCNLVNMFTINNLMMDDTTYAFGVGGIATNPCIQHVQEVYNNLFWRSGNGSIFFARGFNPPTAAAKWEVANLANLLPEMLSHGVNYRAGSGNRKGDPHIATNTGSIGSQSAAIDMGYANPHVYELFEQRFPANGSIKVDFRGNPRPVKYANYDAGAFEVSQ